MYPDFRRSSADFAESLRISPRHRVGEKTRYFFLNIINTSCVSRFSPCYFPTIHRSHLPENFRQKRRSNVRFNILLATVQQESRRNPKTSPGLPDNGYSSPNFSKISSPLSRGGASDSAGLKILSQWIWFFSLR